MRKIYIIFTLAIALLITPLLGSQAFANEGVGEQTDETVNEDVTEEGAAEGNKDPFEETLQLSLQEAIDYAIENNMEIQIANLELEKADVGYSDDVRLLRLLEDGMKVAQVEKPVTFIPYDEPSVYNNMVRNGVARMTVELSLNSAKWNVETTSNKVTYDIEKAYFDLLQIEKEMKIAEENYNLSSKQYEHGKLRFDLGMISRQQLLGLEYNLSQALSGLDSAKMYYNLQKLSFRNTLGLDLSEEFILTDVIEFREYEDINLEDSIELGIENNANIMMSEANLEIQEGTLQSISGRYPEITFRYREQAVEVAKAKGNLQAVKTGVEMQVRSAVLNLQTAEKQIATYEKAVEQAAEGVRIAELSFELGQNTPTEVAQANLNLMNAKKNLAQQIHAFNMALLDYKYSIGIGKGF